jgi:hypothetical protein
MGHRKDLIGPGKQQRQSAPDGPVEVLRDHRVLGSGDFVEQLLTRAESDSPLSKVPLGEIIERVSGTFGLSLTELTSQTRVQRVANARSIICHVAFACGHRGVDIARRLGITGAGVSVAGKRGEKVILEHPDLLNIMNDPIS